MKAKIHMVLLAMIMLACHPKSESEMLESTDVVSLNCSMVSADSPPPLEENVRFVPPVVKDDAVESESKAPNIKPNKSKKIIKDGTVIIKVKNIESSKRSIDTIIKKYSAYYENEEFQNYDNRIRYVLKIRIPSTKFDVFVSSAEKGEGTVTSKIINARDVTEEYVDGEIRLSSKRLFRDRYNGLLSKAAKVEDILAIQENIRVLQEEIESEEGRLKFLDDQVMYSTLEMTLFMDKELIKVEEKKETYFEQMKRSLVNGWASVITFSLWCILHWPWVVVILIAAMILKKFIKNRTKVKK